MHDSVLPTPVANAPLGPRLAVTALAGLAEAGHLLREHLDGGIASHHLLADPGLPALWNGWGLVLVPLLAWLVSGRLVRPAGDGPRVDRPALLRLAGAFAAGSALSIAFLARQSDMAALLFVAILLSALAVRLYRGEYLLGFVLGMSLTFGALLPTLIGGAIALVSAVLWLGLYPRVGRVHSAMHVRRANKRNLPDRP